MDQFDKMSKDFSDLAELRAFSDAQSKQIVELTRQLNQKNTEIENLRRLLADNAPLVSGTPGVSAGQSLKDLTDQEAIATNELRKLKDLSLVQELTYEETKKVVEYTKILTMMHERKPKKVEDSEKKMDTATLLKLVHDSDKTNV
jgi:hypothetical protein